MGRVFFDDPEQEPPISHESQLETSKGFLFEKLIIDLLASSKVPCYRVTKDTALDEDLRISEKRWFTPDLVCELEGIRVFVEVKSTDRNDLLELLQKKVPCLVVITPSNFEQAAEIVRQRVVEIRKSRESANLLSADVLVAIAQLVEQIKSAGGQDLSENMKKHIESIKSYSSEP